VLALVLAAPAAGAGSGAVGRYIVVLRADADSAVVARDHAARHGASVSHVYQAALRGYAATIPEARLAALRTDPRVEFISADREVHAIAQTLPTGINRIEGDLSSQESGNGSGSVGGPAVAAVAVIDTGSGPHGDLNVVGGVNCSSGRRSNFSDGNGHGTHVAGTIGAKDDGAGVVGVAPGVRIYSVRVLNNQGSGSWASVACGIDWVTGRRAEFNDGAADGDAGINIAVANMSLGGAGSDSPSHADCTNANNDALHTAICKSVKAGVTYVVAAGNSNANFATFVPAAYDEVLTVTAMADFNGAPGGGAPATCRADVDETPADFSNFTTPGSSDEIHTIAAPGVCILSTWKGGGYNTISGTSMASPHVAGTAALCIATGNCPGGPSAVISKLRSDAAVRPPGYGFSGDPNSPSGNRYYGYLVYAGGY
jgi:subtilisin family serine protease